MVTVFRQYPHTKIYHDDKLISVYYGMTDKRNKGEVSISNLGDMTISFCGNVVSFEKRVSHTELQYDGKTFIVTAEQSMQFHKKHFEQTYIIKCYTNKG